LQEFVTAAIPVTKDTVLAPRLGRPTPTAPPEPNGNAADPNPEQATSVPHENDETKPT
jgi:hypothetical protein